MKKETVTRTKKERSIMKKPTMNEHVIRAISIGLSAMMAMTPVTALASEVNPQPEGDKEPLEEGQNQETIQEIADAAKQTAEEIKKEGSEEVTTVVNDVKGVEEKGTALDKAADALNDSQTAVEDEAGKVIEDLEKVKKADKSVDGSLEETKKDVDLAVAAANQADQALAEKKTVYEQQVAEISSAKTAEEARNAYDAAKKTEEEAKQTYEDAVAKYDEDKKAYDAAVAAVGEAQKAYDEAVGNAEKDAEAAKKALKDAQDKAEALKAEADKSGEAVANSAAYKIAELEKKIQSDSKRDWNQLDKLFIAIMNDYYLPRQEDVASVKSNVVTKYPDDSKNYFTVVYTDKNGEEQTAYYNYKLDDDKNLLIFKKTFEDVLVKEGEEAKYVINGEDGAVAYSCTEAELKDKLDSGEIINVGTEEKPEYAKVNKDGTTTTLVETGTKTEGNVKTDVAVSDTSVSYVYDPATDTYTRVEKGIVTTTKTYSGVSLSSDEKFETEEAAQEAAKSAAEADAKNVAGDGASVTETKVDIIEETTTTYTGSATYISAFSTTIDMSGIKQSSWSSGGTVAKDIQDNAIDSATAELWDKGYYVLESTGNVKVDKTKDNKIWADDYKTTGDSSITLTYAKFTTQPVEYSLWDDFKDLFQGDKNEKKLAEEVKKKVEAEGGQFIKIEAINWNLGTATCYYVPGNTVKVAEEQKSRDDAENVLKDSADQAAEAGGTVDDQILRMVFGKKKVLENGTTTCNVKTTTDEKSVTTYRYSGTYTAKTQQEKEMDISQTSGYATALSYENAVDPVYDKNRPTNAEFLAGNILLNEKEDLDLRAYIDGAKKQKEDYDRIAKEAQTAVAAVATAQEKVDTLKKKIELLKKKSTATSAELAGLSADLASAELVLKNAQDKYNEIVQQPNQADNTYKEKVTELTPSNPGGGTGGNGGSGDNGGTGDNSNSGNEDNGGTGGNGETGDNGGSDNGGNGNGTGNEDQGGNKNDQTKKNNKDKNTVGGNAQNAQAGGATAAATVNTAANTPAAAPANATVATATTTTVNAANAGVNPAGNVANIEDEAVPLADGALDAETEADNNEDIDGATTIEDGDVAKAAMAEEETTQKMSWWWLLIVAILGVTGEEMYRRHLNKKKEAEAVSQKDMK